MRHTPIRTFTGALLAGLGLLSALGLHAASAGSGESSPKPVVVTYFFLPG